MKRHLYWRLSHPAAGHDLKRVQALRAEIAAKIGSDASVARITQPIRVAGSVHGMSGIRNPVIILARDDQTCTIGDMERRIAAMPTILSISAPVIDTDCRRSASLLHKTIREGGQDGVTRHKALTSMIGVWVRRMWLATATEGEAWGAVSAWNAGHIAERVNDFETLGF